MASTSKIEDIIDEIEAYIDDCKPSAFSTIKKIRCFPPLNVLV